MITGHDFIGLAGRLAVLPGASEAAFRTAVSRAYYGTFHLARTFLEEIGFPVARNLNAHGYLQRQLLNSGHAEGKTAGQILRTLHRNRIVADYRGDDVRFLAPDFARRNVELAHEFNSILSLCRTDPTRSEIRAGIAEYQSKLS